MKEKKYTKPQIEIFKFMNEAHILAYSPSVGNAGTGGSQTITDPDDPAPASSPAKKFNGWIEDE